jgi:geranylgeranyl pyrophosphate synthase
MKQAFPEYLQSCRQRTDRALTQLNQLNPRNQQHQSGCSEHPDNKLDAELLNAMRYSLLNGGKRVRATLVYASATAVNNDCSNEALDAIAASIECLHAYSLIHDDLPAMDDDDLRRGQPTCHKAYDEATAILAGDALQCLAFELLADCPHLAAPQRIALVKALAAAAGARGMVGGQFIDLSMERHTPAIDLLQTIHSLKTGALIRAAITMGAIAASANSAELQALDRYGEAIGLAFQIKDDLLDIEGSTETLGKQQGSDINNSKMTYPSLLGLQGSKDKLDQLLQQARQTLQSFGSHAEQLQQLAHYIVSRDH